MAAYPKFAQFSEIQRIVPLVFRMRFEDHALHLADQFVGHSACRTQVLDELLRQVSYARVRQRTVRI